jgi:hypothetical protein
MNPGHPRWRHGPLACYHLLEGNRREALEATRAGAATARRGGGARWPPHCGSNGDEHGRPGDGAAYATFSDALARRDEIVQSPRPPPRIAELIFGT